MGFLNIDKPAGLTSHDVVARVKRWARQTVGKTKVGHAGTLDPMATGVLVVCVGQATRLSEYAMGGRKRYRAEVHLGVTTDTYDAEGEILQQRDTAHITQDAVQEALTPFRGAIDQIPPMYSAIKKEGKKLYELAREGVEVERPARPVMIYDLQLVAWNPPQFTLDVLCSSGTYIRSLAFDLGEVLGVGAHLSALTRTRSGSFLLEDAATLDSLLSDETWHSHLVQPQDGLRDWVSILLTDEQAQEIQYGRRFSKTDDVPDEFVMGFRQDGHLLAVLSNEGDHWKPHKVFLPET